MDFYDDPEKAHLTSIEYFKDHESFRTQTLGELVFL